MNGICLKRCLEKVSFFERNPRHHYILDISDKVKIHLFFL